MRVTVRTGSTQVQINLPHHHTLNAAAAIAARNAVQSIGSATVWNLTTRYNVGNGLAIRIPRKR